MRTVTYGAACSLDGFITARDGGLDWLHFSRDVEKAMASYWATVDTILMGRKTWEAAMAQGAADSTAAAGADEGGRGKAVASDAAASSEDGEATATYVFSRTLREVPAGVQLVGSDAGEFVRALKEQPGKGICVLGGGELGRSLFEAGVIDELGLNIHPVLLGSGVPLFRDAGQDINLELCESRVIDGGCVYSTYRVRRDR
jgi:dihydrofolate reductase